MPLARLQRTALVIGAPGAGKTGTLARLAHGVASTSDWQVVVIDAKGEAQTQSARRARAAPAGPCGSSRRSPTTRGAEPAARSPTGSRS